MLFPTMPVTKEYIFRFRFRLNLDTVRGNSGLQRFRINPVNIRTRLEHMDELMALLVRECGLVAGTAAKG